MRMRAFLTLTAALALVIGSASARDTRLKLPIKDAMETAAYKEQADANIKLFFGAQAYPKPVQSFGTYTSNKKTNFFNKSDKEGCEWVFLSAVLSMQERARQLGGNAVVGIRSVYRGGNLSSETEYECGAGAIMGGVALEGEVVKLP
jgi:hypothetical protein